MALKTMQRSQLLVPTASVAAREPRPGCFAGLRVRIARHERGLLFRRNDYRGLLAPGEHRLWGNLLRPGRDRVEVVSALGGVFTHPLLEVMLRDAAFLAAADPIELGDEERAIVFDAGRVLAILGPGRHAIWKQPRALAVERFDIRASPRLEHPKLDAILRSPAAAAHLQAVHAEP